MEALVQQFESRIEIRILEPEEVAKYWNDMVSDIQRSMNRNHDRPITDILTGALRRGILVWGAIESGELIGHMSVEIQKDRLAVVALGGSRSVEWISEFNDQLREFAKINEFDHVVASVRPGLQKWLKPLGWKVYRVLMEA